MTENLNLDIRADRKNQGRRFFVSISNETDVFINVETLAEWSSLSVRTLREHLADPVNPLPHYKIGGRILISWPEFKRWMEGFKVKSTDIAGDILKRKNSGA